MEKPRDVDVGNPSRAPIGKVADNATLLEPRGRRLVTTIATTHASPSASRRSRSKVDLLAMPGLKTLVNRRRNSGTETQAPLVKQNGSSGNLIKPAASMASLRKYETVLTVTGVLRSSSSSSSVEPLQPVNRLRVPQESTSRFCSRCSSILTLASTSRYSLNSSTGGFIPILKETLLLCKLCLAEVPSKDACCIEDCKCSFCAECMRFYVKFEIAEGAYDISCPDAQCPSKGVLHEEEIKRLAGDDLFEKHKKMSREEDEEWQLDIVYELLRKTGDPATTLTTTTFNVTELLQKAHVVEHSEQESRNTPHEAAAPQKKTLSRFLFYAFHPPSYSGQAVLLARNEKILVYHRLPETERHDYKHQNLSLMEVVAIDLFRPLPLASTDDRWILIIEEYATLWIELFALVDATAERRPPSSTTSYSATVYKRKSSRTPKPGSEDPIGHSNRRQDPLRLAPITTKHSVRNEHRPLPKHWKDSCLPNYYSEAKFAPLTTSPTTFAVWSFLRTSLLKPHPTKAGKKPAKPRNKIAVSSTPMYANLHDLSNATRGFSSKLGLRRDGPYIVLQQNEPIATKTYTNFRRKIHGERGRKVSIVGTSDKKGKFTADLQCCWTDVVESKKGPLETIRPGTTALIAKRISDSTTTGLRIERYADQVHVESCQSRSSPDSPEGPGLTNSQKDSGVGRAHLAPPFATPLTANEVEHMSRATRRRVPIANRLEAHDLFVIPLNSPDLLLVVPTMSCNSPLIQDLRALRTAPKPIRPITNLGKQTQGV
ncbi:hypothetical protein GEV33_010197 [Tenebrio molitor]|uniref:RBR-type E3 ubiquitin transferase n=1 Tax=Tenebrio molitor TaxID=7067 RepID=A0A8J6HD59_TENMO|nr:hypothetical protein GEV33_010197 [Tenebrio molitor]